MIATGTIATTSIPTSMVFQTGSTATPSVLTQRMVIDSSGNVGIGTITPGSLLTVQSVAANESATLGGELLSATGWASTTNWSGTFATGFTHTNGSVTTLTNTLAATTNYYYQITYTVSAYTTGTFTITFGGEIKSGITATGSWGPLASSAGTLSITPTSLFDGTIVISIKRITGNSAATFAIYDSTGVSNFEIRSSSNTLYNTFIGKDVGSKNTTGNYNTAVGYHSLYVNTTGNNNSAIGYRSLLSNTTGYYNSAVGNDSLYYNTTGYSNSAMGINALYNTTTGYSNSAMGYFSLNSNTTGYQNTAMGYLSGRYITDGATGNATSNNSVYLGYDTRALANGDTNEIVIGSTAIGLGSNSVVLGNDSILNTLLKGNIGIGTITPNSTLQVYGNLSLTGSSTVQTASLGGSLLGAGGCSSVTTSIDTSVSSSTAAFITTPQIYPGVGAWWSSYLSASGVITTQVCMAIAGTPNATVYNVKIIK
ncbi:MAG: hypothetical protein NTV30_08905 [Chloroflexi bacterium]|nr:hypothetical protein [Chloroflexota bacterium]